MPNLKEHRHSLRMARVLSGLLVRKRAHCANILRISGSSYLKAFQHLSTKTKEIHTFIMKQKISAFQN